MTRENVKKVTNRGIEKDVLVSTINMVPMETVRNIIVMKMTGDIAEQRVETAGMIGEINGVKLRTNTSTSLFVHLCFFY